MIVSEKFQSVFGCQNWMVLRFNISFTVVVCIDSDVDFYLVRFAMHSHLFYWLNWIFALLLLLLFSVVDYSVEPTSFYVYISILTLSGPFALKLKRFSPIQFNSIQLSTLNAQSVYKYATNGMVGMYLCAVLCCIHIYTLCHCVWPVNFRSICADCVLWFTAVVLCVCSRSFNVYCDVYTRVFFESV